MRLTFFRRRPRAWRMTREAFLKGAEAARVAYAEGRAFTALVWSREFDGGYVVKPSALRTF